MSGKPRNRTSNAGLRRDGVYDNICIKRMTGVHGDPRGGRFLHVDKGSGFSELLKLRGVVGSRMGEAAARGIKWATNVQKDRAEGTNMERQYLSKDWVELTARSHMSQRWVEMGYTKTRDTPEDELPQSRARCFPRALAESGGAEGGVGRVGPKRELGEVASRSLSAKRGHRRTPTMRRSTV